MSDWAITRQVGGQHGPYQRTILLGPDGQYVLLGSAMPPKQQDALAAVVLEFFNSKRT